MQVWFGLTVGHGVGVPTERRLRINELLSHLPGWNPGGMVPRVQRDVLGQAVAQGRVPVRLPRIHAIGRDTLPIVDIALDQHQPEVAPDRPVPVFGSRSVERK